MPTTTVQLEVTDDGNSFTLNDATKGVLDSTQYTLARGFVDITEYVFSVSLSRGRNRDLEKFNAGSGTIRLRNNTRMFDPLNLSSPFVEEMVPRRIVKVFTDGGQQFQGLVESWRLAYDVSGESLAEISVVDAFSWLSTAEVNVAVPEELSGARITRVLNDVSWGDVGNLGDVVSRLTNFATNPSFEAVSGTVWTPDGVLDVPTGVVSPEDLIVLAFQDVAAKLYGSYGVTVQWPDTRLSLTVESGGLFSTSTDEPWDVEGIARIGLYRVFPGGSFVDAGDGFFEIGV